MIVRGIIEEFDVEYQYRCQNIYDLLDFSNVGFIDFQKGREILDLDSLSDREKDSLFQCMVDDVKRLYK